MYSKISFLKISAFLALTTLVVGLVLYSNWPVQAIQPSGYVKEVVTTNSLAQENPQQLLKAATGSNIQTVNGIKIQLIGVQLISSDLLQANVCFDLPNQEDWLLSNSPDNVFLTIGQNIIFHSGFTEIDVKTDANGNRTQRCDYLNFPVTPGEDLSSFTITINQLVTSVPEQPDCSKAQGMLNAANAGIQISCNNTNGGFSFDIKNKPSTLSDFEARKAVFASFIDTFKGPWVFTSGIK